MDKKLQSSTTVSSTIRNMRCLISLLALISVLRASAMEVCDTVLTAQGDKIILSYKITSDGDKLSIDFYNPPRIISSTSLNKACKWDSGRLKVVLFDRVGNHGNTKWSGELPDAFIVPGGLTYDSSSDGFYILGESLPIEFHRKGNDKVNINFPLNIAVYEDKQKYKIVAKGKTPLTVSYSASAAGRRARRNNAYSQNFEQEEIAITSVEELEADNDDITSALSSIDQVRQLLSRETETPFSQFLMMEIYNLQSLKGRINEPEVINKINDVLRQCSDRERELNEARSQSELAAKAQEEALIQQQKQEEEALRKEAEEKNRAQEEKQQKRTTLMIIGGVILAILGFVGNAIFRHFRDIRNQKSIMEMQKSLARQAQHEAGRRSREMIRNKAHQAANNGRSKLRNSLNNNLTSNNIKKSQNSKRRSI